MSNLKITVRSVRMSAHCACGGTIVLTGSPHGCREGIRLWAEDHQKPGCRPVSKEEQRRIKAQKKRDEMKAWKLAQRRANDDATAQMTLPMGE